MIPCVHCGLPSPTPARPDMLAFCCNGCRGAYELIRGWGLQDFYAIRNDSSGNTATDEDRQRFDDLDHPELLGRSAPIAVTGDQDQQYLRSTLTISGVHCAACLWLLERAPGRVDGWFSSHVRMHARTIDITYDPQTIRLSQIAAVLLRLGYTVSPLAEASDDDAATTESRQLLVDIAIAGFCAANAMWLAIALYAGSFTGIETGHAAAFRIAGVLLGCIAVLFPGRTFFRGALAALKTRTPHMDLPVAVGLAAGVGGSLYGLMDASREVYFDSIASLVFFLLVGRWLQMRGQRRAGDEVAGLVQWAPQVASRRDAEGTLQRVSAKDLQVGDTVVVSAGESLPVDGIVTAGSSLVDRSLLTGESRPVTVDVGTEVEAGTDNLQSTLEISATVVGAQTRLAQLTHAVADAAASRTPIVQLANKIGGWFVVIVLMLAAITAVLWWQRDPSVAIGHVVALLIVACPCALALATPLAIAASVGRLAGRNVLVRSGECLERLVGQGTVFFDKTGTLTAGQMRVTRWQGDQQALAIAAAVESTLIHPIAGAVVSFAQNEPIAFDAATIDQRSVIAGRGVEATTIDGDRVQLGNASYVSAPLDPEFESARQEIQAVGASPIYVVINDQVRAIFGAADTIREDAAEVVDEFRRRDWKIGILSGDHPDTVADVAKRLGVSNHEARGGMMPDEKLAVIQAARQSGVVMMVGDGLNDAAALAAADVGVAIRGGANASLAAAPVIIGDGRLPGLVTLIAMAATTRKVIIRNFALSIAYNIIAVILAMTGFISPLIAAILMPVSSLTVIVATLAGIKVES